MSTPFYLAVDIRTDTTTAAVADGVSRDSPTASGVPLDGVLTMPTAIYVGADELLFGQEALEGANPDDERLILDFVPSVGDAEAVFTADGEEFAPVDLYAWTVDNVIDRMTEIRGAAPAGVWVVVPATWDDASIAAIADALDRDGRTDVDFITVPEALASRYAQIDPSDSNLTLVVCDVDDRSLQAAIMLAFPGGGSRQIGAPILAAISEPGEESEEVDERAIDAIVLALSDAGVDIDTLDAVVLSGASVDLGYFKGLLVDRFGEPIDTDPDPARATVTGAAIALALEGAELAAAAPIAVLVPPAAAAAAGAVGATRSITSTVRTATRSSWYRRPVGAIALGVGGVLLAGAVTVGSAYAIGGIGTTAEEKRTLPEVAVVQVPNDSADTAVPSAKPTTPAPAPSPIVPPAAEETDDAAPPVVSPRVPSTTTPRTPSTPSTPVADPASPAPAQPAPPGVTPDVTPEPTPDPVPTITPEPEPEPEPTEEPTPEPTPDPTPSETSSPTPPAEEVGSDTP